MAGAAAAARLRLLLAGAGRRHYSNAGDVPSLRSLFSSVLSEKPDASASVPPDSGISDVDISSLRGLFSSNLPPRTDAPAAATRQPTRSLRNPKPSNTGRDAFVSAALPGLDDDDHPPARSNGQGPSSQNSSSPSRRFSFRSSDVAPAKEAARFEELKFGPSGAVRGSPREAFSRPPLPENDTGEPRSSFFGRPSVSNSNVGTTSGTSGTRVSGVSKGETGFARPIVSEDQIGDEDPQSTNKAADKFKGNPYNRPLENGLDPGIYKAIMVGKVGQQPMIKRLKTGRKVVLFSLATGGMRNNRRPLEGEKPADYAEQNLVQWHRVCIYPDVLGNIALKQVKSGSILYLEGNLETKMFTDPETGLVRRIREIAIRTDGRLLFLGSDTSTSQSDPRAFRGVGYF